MQLVKERLQTMSMAFTSPWLAVLYALIPWFPEARKQRQSAKRWAKVKLYIA